MIKRGNKLGQFYLIAAIVIIALVLGLLAITNYTANKENIRVKELSNELQVESGKLLERGAATDDYPWDHFSRNFSLYAGKDVDVIYAVGTKSTHEAFRYNESLDKITDFTNEYDIASNKYTIVYDNVNRTFQFREGQNFYFLIVQKVQGEIYVASNE